MSRFALVALSAMLTLSAQVSHADAPSVSAAPTQDHALPHFAVGKTARAFSLTVGAYALAGATTIGFLGLNFFCDQNGDLVNIGCNTVGFPVAGVFVISGLTAAAIAPSAAHWKLGDTNHAYLTTGLRLGGATVLLLGLKEFADNDLDGRATLLLTTGTATLVGLGLYDIVDAGFAPHRLAKKEALANLRLHPAPLVSKDGQTSLGLFATGHF